MKVMPGFPRRLSHAGKLYLRQEKKISIRELDVIEAKMNYVTNIGAGKMLFLTEKTVKFHLTNIYRKLELGGIAEMREVVRPFMEGIDTLSIAPVRPVRSIPKLPRGAG